MCSDTWMVLLILALLTSAAGAEPVFLGKTIEDWENIVASDEDARRSLSKRGEEIVPLLRSLLAHESPEVRDGALRVLRVGTDVRIGLTPDLIARLGDEKAGIRFSAATVLARYGDRPGTVPALLGLLTDESAEVRAHAAYLLAFTRSRRAVEPLADRLGDPDPGVRLEALLSLLALDGARPVATAIARLMRDPDALLRSLAEPVLSALGEGDDVRFALRGVDVWTKRLGGDFCEQWEAGRRLLAGGASAVPMLRRLLSADDPTAVENTLMHMDGAASRRSLAPDVAACLRHPSVEVREAAAWCLPRFTGHPVMIPALVRALDDPVETAAVAAACSLVDLGVERERTSAILLPALDAECSPLVIRAVGRLGELAAPAVPRIVARLEDRFLPARMAAAGALGRLGLHLDRCLALIASELSHESRPVSVRDALREIGPRAREVARPRMGALDGEDASARLDAAEVALAVGLETEKALTVLLCASAKRSLDSWRRSFSALHTWTAEPRVNAGLIPLMLDGDEELRRLARGHLRLRDDGLIFHMERAIRAGPTGRRRRAVRLLVDIGRSSRGDRERMELLVAPLVVALLDEELKVECELALRAWTGPALVRALEKRYQDEDVNVRRVVKEALAALAAQR